MNYLLDIYNSGETRIVCYKVEKLKKIYKNIRNWKYNREADPQRISNIKNYMIKSEIDICPGLICAWDTGDGLEIYDGFHRYSACESLNKCKILIKIISTVDENLVKKDFELVNKSLYVPGMYLETNLMKNKVCNDVFVLMKNNFPNNVSYSNNPQQQNFNQNSIIEIVKNINIDFSNQYASTKIHLELLKVNEEIKALGIKPRYKKTLVTGFWLFFWDNEKIINTVNENLI